MINPRFNVPPSLVAEERRRMASSPIPLQRPVVVLSGWRAPRSMSALLVKRLRGLTGDDPRRIRAFAYPTAGSIPSAAEKLRRFVERAWPERPGRSIDAIGISMGGLVLRWAAARFRELEEPIAVRRIFTLCTPHRGARLTALGAIDEATRDMTPGSDFLRRIDAERGAAGYELVCYARTRDWWVGATNAAPPGEEPIWREPPRLTLSHLMVSRDWPIALDIARRLRGEPPLAEGPSRPPRD